MATTLTITPEIGIPLDTSVKGHNYVDLRERAMAVCNTATDLSQYGLDVEPDDSDREIATLLAQTYAQDPEKVSKEITNTRAAKMRPASLVLAGNILDEFGQVVVEDSLQIRHMVTNKLLLESENPDARVRLRALEMLGKISDVGLFTEKKEITVQHTSTEELKAKLKNKLTRLIDDAEPVAEGEFEQVIDQYEKDPESSNS